MTRSGPGFWIFKLNGSFLLFNLKNLKKLSMATSVMKKTGTKQFFRIFGAFLLAAIVFYILYVLTTKLRANLETRMAA